MLIGANIFDSIVVGQFQRFLLAVRDLVACLFGELRRVVPIREAFHLTLAKQDVADHVSGVRHAGTLLLGSCRSEP